MEFLTILLTIVTGVLLFYYYFIYGTKHFKRLGVLHEIPLPFFGNMAKCLFRRVSAMDHLHNFYNKYSHAKYFGFFDFSDPVIVIRDLDLINQIAVKNFDSFTDHRNFVDSSIDPLVGGNLFGLRGDEWREMRRTLSPAFTSSKMKLMHKLMCECGTNFTGFLSKEMRGGKVVNVKDIFSRYSNDVVATCAFGISIDSMNNPDNDFYVLGKKVGNFESSLSLKFMLLSHCVTIAKILNIRMFEQKVADFFEGIVADTIKERKEKGIFRPDMIQLMMESNETRTNLSVQEMTSQAFVFFFAGFDSTSTLMSFIVHELAVNLDVQSRLREEVDGVLRLKTDGKPTYEDISEMKYLDAVINEALRLYPLIHFLNRVCVKDFELPPATPHSKPVTVKKGETIWFPSAIIHRDPKYFPRPNKFDPERFLTGKIYQPAYMPFGMGPRICIANRFALLNTKIAIFHLISSCNVEPCSKTTIPMRFSKKAFLMMPENGFWLKFTAR